MTQATTTATTQGATMNTTTDLTGATWAVGSLRASFSAQSRNWGVMNAEGLVLSKDGVTPSTWKTKAIAEMVAPYDGGFASPRWVEIAS